MAKAPEKCKEGNPAVLKLAGKKKPDAKVATPDAPYSSARKNGGKK